MQSALLPSCRYSIFRETTPCRLIIEIEDKEAMDEILLYQYCHQAIAILIRDGALDLDNCRHISEEYAKAIFIEIKDSPATISQNTMQIKQGFLQVNMTEARKLYDSGYYIRKAQNKENEIRILHATEESAQAASRSAESAEKANEIARKSNYKATIANVIAFIALISSLFLNYCQNRLNNDKSDNIFVTSVDTVICKDTNCYPSIQNVTANLNRNEFSKINKE